MPSYKDRRSYFYRIMGVILTLIILPSLNAGIATAKYDVVVQVPRDDAGHVGALAEWWQWWTHVETEDGRKLGVMVIFTQSQGVQISQSVRIVDYDTKEVQTADKVNLGIFQYEPDSFAFTSGANDGITASGSGGRDTITATVPGMKLEYDLIPDETTHVVPLFNPEGNYKIDTGTVSLYQRQRVPTVGVLTENGQTSHFTATTWFEHAFFTTPEVAIASWDYVQLELNDGRNIQAMHIRRGVDGPDFEIGWQGQISNGTGNVDYLTPEDIDIVRTEYWSSPNGCNIPVGLKVMIRGEEFDVQAVANNQGNSRAWDGEAYVSGSVDGVGVIEIVNAC
ncbi:MAG: lipocalin family protein [Mycobacteriaceae bacterium]